MVVLKFRGTGSIKMDELESNGESFEVSIDIPEEKVDDFKRRALEANDTIQWE